MRDLFWYKCFKSFIFSKFNTASWKIHFLPVVCCKKPNAYFGDPPKYVVVTRELKFIFLRTLTCLQCRTGYNFMCNLFSKTWILTLLMWNCPGVQCRILLVFNNIRLFALLYWNSIWCFLQIAIQIISALSIKLYALATSHKLFDICSCVRMLIS